MTTTASARPPTIGPVLEQRFILGMRVDATRYQDAVDRVLGWARERASRYVCIANVHMTMEAYDDSAFQAIVNQADLVTPDGMPLVWALRALGVRDATRVAGPDLMLDVCDAAAAAGVPVGFHGGSEATLAALRARLRRTHPELDVVYAESPPFRPPTDVERSATIAAIVSSGARVLFVGLGCPKQERWMAEQRGAVPAVMIGVGAAFDFHAGLVKRAPATLQRAGLEWAYRLAMEPRRLFVRYTRHNPRFLALLAVQLLRSRAWGRCRVGSGDRRAPGG